MIGLKFTVQFLTTSGESVASQAAESHLLAVDGLVLVVAFIGTALYQLTAIAKLLRRWLYPFALL